METSQWTKGSSLWKCSSHLEKIVFFKKNCSLKGSLGELKMVLLYHHCENSLLEPFFFEDCTFLSLNILMHSQICQIMEINWVAKTNSHWLYNVWDERLIAKYREKMNKHMLFNSRITLATMNAYKCPTNTIHNTSEYVQIWEWVA